MNIQILKATQTYAMRQQLLRPDFSVEECRFAEDDLASSCHFGAYQDNQLLGIVTVLQLPEPDSSASSDNAWQIRAMATMPEVRGEGYGAALINVLEDYVRKQSGKLIWCNARSGAVGFYQKLGYVVEGEQFEIPAVGAHFRMKKSL